MGLLAGLFIRHIRQKGSVAENIRQHPQNWGGWQEFCIELFTVGELRADSGEFGLLVAIVCLVPKVASGRKPAKILDSVVISSDK